MGLVAYQSIQVQDVPDAMNLPRLCFPTTAGQKHTALGSLYALLDYRCNTFMFISFESQVAVVLT